MLGAIIGDIAGSRFEFNNCRRKDFGELLDEKRCYFTDDSIMTLAIARALLDTYKSRKSADLDTLKVATIDMMKTLGNMYPKGGYGLSFLKWLVSPDSEPYYSFGNGSAMRVSPVAYVARTIKEVKALSEAVTGVTHNHPEGLKGAEATAVAIFLANSGDYDIPDIKKYIEKHYYKNDFTLDEIRDINKFDETCQVTVPQAFQAFYESENFEDSIRNAISIGGDSDTIACITGSIAEAFYGIPEDLEKKALSFLDGILKNIYLEFNKKFM